MLLYVCCCRAVVSSSGDLRVRNITKDYNKINPPSLKGAMENKLDCYIAHLPPPRPPLITSLCLSVFLLEWPMLTVVLKVSHRLVGLASSSVPRGLRL